MTKLEKLTKQIKSLPKSFLTGLPDEDKKVFQNYKIFPIDILVPAEWNYKEDNEELSGKLRNNIKRIGQIENIHVRKLKTGYYEVLNGNHRLKDMLALGKKNVFAYDHGNISRAEAIRRAIETNETKFDTNNIALAERMKDIIEDGHSIEELARTMPYSEEQLKGMEELLDFDWDKFQKSTDESSKDSFTKKVEIYVTEDTHLEWLKWIDRCRNILGYESDSKCFEFAITEALNIPEESLQ